jgi:hypothetical protein
MAAQQEISSVFTDVDHTLPGKHVWQPAFPDLLWGCFDFDHLQCSYTGFPAHAPGRFAILVCMMTRCDGLKRSNVSDQLRLFITVKVKYFAKCYDVEHVMFRKASLLQEIFGSRFQNGIEYLI